MSVRFGHFRLDSSTRQLFRDDAEVHLSPKAYELLRRLIDARPTALSKEHLIGELWPETFVSDASLSVLISEIRRALEDRPANPRFVRTVHKFGYAFSDQAMPVAASSPAVANDRPTYWLTVGTRRIMLAEGENWIGRDPHASVWCDQTGISRRHARIVIANGNATIEDLKSKNGTYVLGTRVVGPTRLSSGDEIRLGSASFTFLIVPPSVTTDTQSVSGAAAPAS